MRNHTEKFLTVFICLIMLAQTHWAYAAQVPRPTPQAIQLIETFALQEGGQALREHPRWKQPTHIVVAIPPILKQLSTSMIKRLQTVAGGAEIKTYFLGDPIPDYLQYADIVFGVCSTQLLEQLPQLVWFQNFSSGVEACTSMSGVKDADFVLTNIQHIAAPTIAEHAITLSLMLSRNMHRYHSQQLQSKWQRQVGASVGVEGVGGKTMLVLGLGGIGTEVAKRAHSLGMRVIATRNSSREGPDFVDQVGLSDEMYTLAKQADIVVNALPLTRATANLIDEKFFAAMKQGSHFVSVGRGKTTDLNALIKALNNNHLAGAGLDVTEPEPLPATHPLWTMDNVIITPHVAGFSMTAIQRSVLLYQENLRRYSNGDKLLNVVDINRGY